jgi:hypothetical protein
MLESHTPKEMYEKKLFSPYMSDIPIMVFTRHGKMCHFSTLPRGGFLWAPCDLSLGNDSDISSRTSDPINPKFGSITELLASTSPNSSPNSTNFCCVILFSLGETKFFSPKPTNKPSIPPIPKNGNMPYCMQSEYDSLVAINTLRTGHFRT